MFYFMVTKKPAFVTNFAGIGREKAHLNTAYRVALANAKPVKPLIAIAQAKKLLRNEPAGCAVKLATGVYLKKLSKGKFDITSLQ
jgi:hypothetical protein